MMRILALDLATNTGWAALYRDTVTYGEFNVASKDDYRARRLRIFRLKLREMLDFRTKIMAPNIYDQIWYEATVQRGAASYWFHAWETILLLEADQRKIPCYTVNTKTLKKWSAGNGNAPKDDMVASAVKFLAMFDHDNPCIRSFRSGKPGYDAADALCILHYAIEHQENGEDAQVELEGGRGDHHESGEVVGVKGSPAA